MKKLLFGILTYAMLLLTGCQEEIGPVMHGGNATFILQTPDVATKTIGDGGNADIVYYEIYLDDSGHVNSLTGKPLVRGKVGMKGGKAELNLNLVKELNYVALFWAQVNGTEYYDCSELRGVKVKYPEVDGVKTIGANNEDRAAFYGRYTFSTDKPKGHEVTLVRPFAQLNLGTTTQSLNMDYPVALELSQVAVSGVATQFNVAEEKAVAESEDVLYSYAAVPAANGEALTVNGTTYEYVSMNYFLVPDNAGTVDIVYDIQTDAGTVNKSVPSVHVKKNYRTNIIGNLLTQETTIEIIVDENFDTPDKIEEI